MKYLQGAREGRHSAHALSHGEPCLLLLLPSPRQQSCQHARGRHRHPDRILGCTVASQRQRGAGGQWVGSMLGNTVAGGREQRGSQLPPERVPPTMQVAHLQRTCWERLEVGQRRGASLHTACSAKAKPAPTSPPPAAPPCWSR
jgi:hypothetical protein